MIPVKRVIRSRTSRAPVSDDLRAGDYVLLFLYRGLRYHREQRLLLWADGTRKALFAMSPDTAARIMGGYSLLVLAE